MKSDLVAKGMYENKGFDEMNDEGVFSGAANYHRVQQGNDVFFTESNTFFAHGAANR